MAKVISAPLQVSGKIGNVVYVNSKTYGYHARMGRGTHKKAAVNETLACNAQKAAFITQFARTLHTLFCDTCRFFKQRDLWQQMLSRLFRASTSSVPHLLESLVHLEMNNAYPLNRFYNPPGITVSIQKQKAVVMLEAQTHPQFAPSLQADAYYYSFTLIWLGKKGKLCEWEVIETEWIPFSQSPEPFTVTFLKPVKAHYYLLLLQIQGGREGKDIESFAAIAAKVVAAGEC